MGDDSDSEGELFSNADSIRDSLDRRFKLSIKRLVKYEVKPDKLENRVLVRYVKLHNWPLNS